MTRAELPLLGTIASANRLAAIVAVLAKYGFGELVQRLGLQRRPLIRRLADPELLALPATVRLRRAIEELGPAAIKIGQLLSMRPDMLPADICAELTLLQESLPPQPFPAIEESLTRAYGKPPLEVFARFEAAPVATASVSQVHRAELPDGRAVAVKVRLPGVEETLAADLDILEMLAGLLEEHLPSLRKFRPRDVVRQLRKDVSREMDFHNEAANMAAFAAIFDRDATVRAPGVVPELVRRDVLVMDFVEGERLDACDCPPEAREALALAFMTATMRQILLAGFFHADPHLGNLRVVSGWAADATATAAEDDAAGVAADAPSERGPSAVPGVEPVAASVAPPGDVPDGDSAADARKAALGGRALCYLDFGLCGRLAPDMRTMIFQLLSALSRRDVPHMADAILDMASRVPPDLDRLGLEADLMFAVQKTIAPGLSSPMGGFLLDATEICRERGIAARPDFLLMARAMLAAEAAVRALCPGLDVTAHLERLAKDFALERLLPGAGGNGAILEELENAVRALTRAPKRLGAILRKLETGDLSVEFKLLQYGELPSVLRRIGNRLGGALVTSAMVVGSSVVFASDLGPHLWGMPVVGLAGFLVAGVLAVYLTLKMFGDS